MDLKIIAHIDTDLDEKFGIPRQSGLVPSLQGRIVFEPGYRDPNALRGLEGYDYIWLIWHFSEVPRNRPFTPLVRPPRLGGNKKVGVFASRSPFRPNPIGLSCVRLEKIEMNTPQGPVIYVGGVDMKDGTPILDIKPYHPGVEAHPGARGGFSDDYRDYRLEVRYREDTAEKIPAQMRESLTGLLAQDPRPGYQHSPDRIYGISFAGYNVRFTVDGNILTVIEVTK